jgi:hypothetical protein
MRKVLYFMAVLIATSNSQAVLPLNLDVEINLSSQD